MLESRHKVISKAHIGKGIFRDSDRRHRIRPAGVKRKMRNDLRNLARFDTVVECEVEIVRHLDRLATRNQGGNGYDAAVPRRESRALP